MPLISAEILYDITITNPLKITAEPISCANITVPCYAGENKRAFLFRTTADIKITTSTGIEIYYGTDYSLVQTDLDIKYSKLYNTVIYSEIIFKNPGEYLITYLCVGSYVKASLLNYLRLQVKNLLSHTADQDTATAANTTRIVALESTNAAVIPGIITKNETQDTAISALETTAQAHTTALSLHSSQIATNTSTNNEQNTQLAEHTSAFTAIDGAITQIETDITGINAVLDSLTGGTGGQITQLVERVANLEQQDTVIDSRIGQVETVNLAQDNTLLQHTSTLTTLATSVTDAVTTVGNMSTAVTTHTTDISVLQTQTNDHGTRLTTHEQSDDIHVTYDWKQEMEAKPSNWATIPETPSNVTALASAADISTVAAGQTIVKSASGGIEWVGASGITGAGDTVSDTSTSVVGNIMVAHDTTGKHITDSGVAISSIALSDYTSPKIEGLIISNNLADVTNDLNISAGFCNDSTRASRIELITALIKQLDAPWAAGSNAGLLQSGQTKANSKSYRLYLIASADDTLVDIIATEYNIALILPAGYTKYRYIGSIRTLSGGAIQRFEHIGNEFVLYTDTTMINGSVTAGTITHTVSNIPLGLTHPIVRCLLAQASTGSASVIVNHILPDTTTGLAFIIASGASGDNQVTGYVVLNAAYAMQLVVATTGTRIMHTLGYIDRDREAF